MSMLVTLDRLPKLLEPRRANGIVLAHGCWDILHIGHIRHFQEAAKLSGTLVVTVTPDRHVNKGHGRPLFNEQMRAEAVAALSCVDFVAINDKDIAPVEFLRPNVYVKGAEYRKAMTP